MRHIIVAKFINKDEAINNINDIKNIFNELNKIPGIYKVNVSLNAINKENRNDIFIEILMDKEALPLYDVSKPHLLWKEKYGSMIKSKAIIDVE